MADCVVRLYGQSGAAPCFASGTRLLGPSGEVAVEQLRPGEQLVALRRGGLAAVRWVGRRTLFPARHPQPAAAAPVRIDAGAFRPGVPHRDLVLSPDHAVHLPEADVLVPVRHLLNGSSIRQEPGSAAVTYFHVELADAAGAAMHDVVLAEGLAAESYLDTGHRANFANGGPLVMLHPTLARDAPDPAGCAPFVSGGPAVAAARERLRERAHLLGWRLSMDPGLRVMSGGRKFLPERCGGAWCWRLPPDTDEAWLVSRPAAGSTGAEGTDARPLGVAVRSITLDGRRIPLDDPRLGVGWHAREHAVRWTTGAARIAGPLAGTLRIRLATAGRYWRRGTGGAAAG